MERDEFRLLNSFIVILGLRGGVRFNHELEAPQHLILNCLTGLGGLRGCQTQSSF